MLTTDQVLGKGRYRILSSYANDAAGGLYEAYDTQSNVNVVLRENVGRLGKVATATQLDAINEAFLGEAKVLAEIRHESLLSVQDYFSEIDRHYLVMESVDGYDLTKLLDSSERPPALKDVLSWADQLLDALHFLHTLPKPRIHRDVRPANIRLTSSFKVKLVTAGIAANEDADLITPSAGNPADTAVLNYRPLEQLWGGLDAASQKVIANSYDEASQAYLMQPLDARSDIYSLGATIYHILTRTLPKDALERSIEMLEGNTDPLPPAHALEPSVPTEISEVLTKALSLKRQDRFDSAAIMRQVLRTAQVRIKERKATEVPIPRAAPEPLAEALSETIIEVHAVEADVDVDKELSQVEERRRQLEAEQQRLQQEQQLLEQRRLELEAEEKRRADLRRLEMEADLERQRREAERIKQAELEAAERARAAVEMAKRSSLSASAVEEPPILELDTVTDSKLPVAPASFEWSEEELKIPVAAATMTTSSPDVRAYGQSRIRPADFDLSVFAGGPAASKRIYLIGAGLLAVLLFVGWLFIGGSPSGEPDADVVAKPAVVPQSAEPQPIYTPTVESKPSSVPFEDQIEQSPTISQTDVNSARPESLATKPKKKVAKSTAPPKKSVTVDDLINDN